MRLGWKCLSALAILAAAGTARADESYYLLMFASQRSPNWARHAHSFATFVKVTRDGAAGPAQVEAHTISWLPKNLHIKIFNFLPQTGHNFDLHETLNWVLCGGHRVSLWGPFQIRKELYGMGLCQIARLETGATWYKAVDTGYFCSVACNCMHAIMDINSERRGMRISSPGWGEHASETITHGMDCWLIDPCTTHPWVAELLGLGKYPITQRNWEPPGSCKCR